MALALILPLNQSILQKFYCKLIPCLKINRNILPSLSSISFYVGGFQLKSLEIEQYKEAISIFILLFNTLLPLSDLLK